MIPYVFQLMSCWHVFGRVCPCCCCAVEERLVVLALLADVQLKEDVVDIEVKVQDKLRQKLQEAGGMPAR